ncbi:MAG TPA: DNA-formamidopyrimidine glycosylase family protein [Gammaproteobacteria bacterium]|nr:DNA-formamidopyrimidine glycosylase family protein [Gammaproteobacteria bacterium]
MPELPDITVYVEALRERIGGARLERYRLPSPFLLRSVEPPLDALVGLRVATLERLGKRIVIGFEGELFLVIHLMIAGRLQWRADRPKKQSPNTQLVLELDTGTLFMTEAGTKRRASLYVVRGRGALAEHDRGGLEIAGATLEQFRAALTRGNHTLKRALTDPTMLSGIGNAYSDEILHRARLSPIALTSKVSDEEYARLFDATREVLAAWTVRLRAQSEGEFPSKVTAFHDEMAVHGKYGQPCPVCGTKVQRIRYADNETNYCPRCQTGGRLLADRSLSRLLKKDWPKSIDELERMRR